MVLEVVEDGEFADAEVLEGAFDDGLLEVAAEAEDVAIHLDPAGLVEFFAVVANVLGWSSV